MDGHLSTLRVIKGKTVEDIRRKQVIRVAYRDAFKSQAREKGVQCLRLRQVGSVERLSHFVILRKCGDEIPFGKKIGQAGGLKLTGMASGEVDRAEAPESHGMGAAALT